MWMAPLAPSGLDWENSGAGIEADLGSAQVPPEGVQPLLDAVRAGLDRLNAIRREIWTGLRAAGTERSTNPSAGSLD
jgi:hypothetical protein